MEKIVCYLRPDNEQDQLLKQAVENSRAGGLTYSEIIRSALTQYYFPPAPKTDPILIAMMKALATLSESLKTQSSEIARIYDILDQITIEGSQVELLEDKIARLQTCLKSAIYDRSARQKIKLALESDQNG